MSVTYRDAVPGDAPALEALFRDTFVATFGHLYGAEDLATFLAGHGEEKWREELGDAAVAVRMAEDDGAAAGYLKLTPLRSPANTEAAAAEIGQLYVAARWHGSGVAAALMEWALGEARRRGARELYLSVFIDNHRARRFYQRYGFTVHGPNVFMVGNQADEDVLMKLEL
ncbi:GNAT family N-acetyltransferase [Sphingomonas sp.]|uniref:GNAT family N-acetyltransferase n=1 Tax=Sphingomonas sp. TaxID=28214 RepID=UPI00286E70B2|nr:GNAT family N-acetyltransferase [Sphingomonas sp.]